MSNDGGGRHIAPHEVGSTRHRRGKTDASLLKAGRIISAEDVLKLSQRDEDVPPPQAAARFDAAEIERIGAEARREGFERGCADAAELMAAIARRHWQAAEKNLHDLADITMIVVRKIIENYDQIDLVTSTIAKLLQEPERQRLEVGGGPLTLIVHPKVGEDIRRRLEERLGKNEVLQLVKITYDDDIAVDRCLLSGAYGSVELGIEQQLEALYRGLLGGDHLTIDEARGLSPAQSDSIEIDGVQESS